VRLLGLQPAHPGFEQPWEADGSYGKPGRIVSALDIMLEGPIGAAAFNNEFGRPNLAGYFRTFEQDMPRPGGASSCAAITSRSCSPEGWATSAPSTSRRTDFPVGTAS
jgi:phosphoribosylformylglycinamidine synthase